MIMLLIQHYPFLSARQAAERTFALLLICGCLLISAAYAETKRHKIAFASCLNGYDPEIWLELKKQSPDSFLLLGDNIYTHDTDFLTPGRLGQLYQINFGGEEAAKVLANTPTFAIWDDHDFGPNNSDASFPFREISLSAFRKQWAGNPAAPPGLAGSVAFKIESDFFKVLMTDNRSYRVNHRDKAKRAVFGSKQLEWLISELKSPDKPLIIIASGNTLLLESAKIETLSDVPHEQSALYDAISEAKSRVIVISGDLHYAQYSERRIGKKIISELISSPFTAAIRGRRDPSPDPYLVKVFENDNNFGILELGFDSKELSVQGKIISRKGETVINQELR